MCRTGNGIKERIVSKKGKPKHRANTESYEFVAQAKQCAAGYWQAGNKKDNNNKKRRQQRHQLQTKGTQHIAYLYKYAYTQLYALKKKTYFQNLEHSFYIYFVLKKRLF